MRYTRTSFWTVLMAVCTLVAALTSATSCDIEPPSGILLEPLPEGMGFNISWDPSNTTASIFRVSRVCPNGTLFAIGMGTRAQPWSHIRGQIPGQKCVFVVQSLTDDGSSNGPPSEPVTGWPLPPIGYQSSSAPPILDPLRSYTNKRVLTVGGTAPVPGSTVQLDCIPLAKGFTTSFTMVTSALTGRFSLDVNLEEGTNLVHAKVLNEGAEDSNWSVAKYVTLDLEPPRIVVTGHEGEHLVGAYVNLSANMSTDNSGIAGVNWSLGPPVNITTNSISLIFKPNEVGRYPVLLKVADLAGNVATLSIELDVILHNGPVKLENLPKHVNLVDGSRYTVDLNDWLVVGDYEGQLDWNANGGNGSLITWAVEGSILTIVAQKGHEGRSKLNISVGGSSGPLAEGTITVIVNPITEDSFEVRSIMMALLMVFGSVVGVLTIPSLRTRLLRTTDRDEPDTPLFFMKSVFYIHMDGRMIADLQADEGGQIDPDMISSMFTAIQTFVQESFRDSGSLENIVFGENTLTVVQGQHTYLAMVSYGPLCPEFVNKAKEIVRRIEAEFSGVIEEWDGSYTRLSGIEGMIRPLMSNNSNRSLSEIRRECKPKEVRLHPTIDLRHGFVRYSLDIANDTDEILIDLHVDLLWDKQVLALVRYEPDGCKVDGRYRLDNIEPDGSVKLELFFDPLMCLESFIRGSVTYMDIQGRLHTIQLENVLADINCPIFFTVSNANTAMLRKLIEEDLDYKDNKVYRFSAVLKSQQVFEIAKSAVGSYDIQFVRDFLHDDPFIGEAWYYGETKIYNYKVVVCITVREEDCAVEFLVASTLPTTITGLLAELGQLFLKRMDDKYTQGYNLNRVVRRLVKDESMKITDRPSMLMDNLEGDAEPPVALSGGE